MIPLTLAVVGTILLKDVTPSMVVQPQPTGVVNACGTAHGREMIMLALLSF
jgi:hypothetical protein